MLCCCCSQCLVSIQHDFFKTLINLFNAPIETGRVLYPLKITHGHTTSVRQYIRNNHNTFIGQDIVSFLSSHCLRDHAAPPGTEIVRITPPLAIRFWKGAKLVLSKAAVTS